MSRKLTLFFACLIVGAGVMLSISQSDVASAQTNVTATPAIPFSVPEFPVNDQEKPAYVLASYYNAINLGDYTRAYGYWNGAEPSGATLATFTRGFADTEHVELWTNLPENIGAAAGSAYADVPVLLVATKTNGVQEIFAGCFTTRKSNVPAGNATEPDPNWYLYDADLTAVTTLQAGLIQAAQGCENR